MISINPLSLIAKLLVFLFVVLMFMLCSCSPEKRLQNIREKYPEAFKSDTVIKTTYLFQLDTTKVDNSRDTFYNQTDSIVKALLASLDSCSKEDKSKIALLPGKTSIIYKDRFINDCPKAQKKDTLIYHTAEGHTITLTPTESGYDIYVVANCPKCPGDKWIDWWQLIGLGFVAGVLVTGYIIKKS